MAKRELIIKATHRGLRYSDGRLTDVLEAGRYELPKPSTAWIRRPKVEIVLVDMRERELTIKGQEILTSDKVAVRVSILTQYRSSTRSRRSRRSPRTRTASTATSSWPRGVPWRR